MLQAFLFQAHEIITGFGDIHINGIELLYRRHCVSLTICHQGTFGHAGFADAAADWRRHFCVRQVNTRAFHGCFCGDNVGIGLARGRHRLIVFLLADIFCAEKRRVAFDR